VADRLRGSSHSASTIRRASGIVEFASWQWLEVRRRVALCQRGDSRVIEHAVVNADFVDIAAAHEVVIAAGRCAG